MSEDFCSSMNMWPWTSTACLTCCLPANSPDLVTWPMVIATPKFSLHQEVINSMARSWVIELVEPSLYLPSSRVWSESRSMKICFDGLFLRSESA